MHVAAVKTNQADHGKKRDPRDDEIQSISNLELDNDARLKKQTFWVKRKKVRFVPIVLQKSVDIFSEQ